MPERGPNLELFDHVGSIRDEPLFASWRNPVPPQWFQANARAYTLVDQEALYGTLTFARVFGRTASEVLSAPTDVANITGRGRSRSGVENPNVPADVAVSQRNFIRNASESLATPVDTGVKFRNSGALINPMVDEYP